MLFRSSLADVESKIDSTVKMLFLETITNPQMEVADMRALAELAHRHNILLVADTTLTPPYVFDAKSHGVDLEVFSTTKFVSGGGTSVGGLIIDHGNFDWTKNQRIAALVEKHGQLAFQVKLRKEVYRNTGACLSPMNAFLQTVGLETLALRMDRSVDNAQKLSAWLQGLQLEMDRYDNAKKHILVCIKKYSMQDLTSPTSSWTGSMNWPKT